MKGSFIATLTLVSLLQVGVQGNEKTQAVASAPQSVVGTWRGRMNDVPAVDLTITRDGNRLTGTAVFYVVVDDGNGPKVTGKAEHALIDPKFDGNALIFSFKRKDGSVFKAQMRLLNNGDAELKALDDPSADENTTVKMIREK
jgi:hypothetical protein